MFLIFLLNLFFEWILNGTRCLKRKIELFNNHFVYSLNLVSFFSYHRAQGFLLASFKIDQSQLEMTISTDFHWNAYYYNLFFLIHSHTNSPFTLHISSIHIVSFAHFACSFSWLPIVIISCLAQINTHQNIIRHEGDREKEEKERETEIKVWEGKIDKKGKLLSF